MSEEIKSKSFKNVEDIVAWQKATKLVLEVYKLTNKGDLARDFSLRDQVRRSAISVPSNIAEGFGRGGSREFNNFLSISKGSLYKLKTQLFIASELNYFEKNQLMDLNANMDELARIITGLMNYLQNTEIKGSKFKVTAQKNY